MTIGIYSQLSSTQNRSSTVTFQNKNHEVIEVNYRLQQIHTLFRYTR